MEEYYKKFPDKFKKVLLEKKVIFPDSLEKDYEPFAAYRGIRLIPHIKDRVEKEDFRSQIERASDFPGIDYEDIENYSCSCFIDIDELLLAFRLPRKNKGIARGNIRKEYGPICREEESSHINWFLFNDADPSSEFEVIKNEE